MNSWLLLRHAEILADLVFAGIGFNLVLCKQILAHIIILVVNPETWG